MYKLLLRHGKSNKNETQNTHTHKEKEKYILHTDRLDIQATTQIINYSKIKAVKQHLGNSQSVEMSMQEFRKCTQYYKLKLFIAMIQVSDSLKIIRSLIVINTQQDTCVINNIKIQKTSRLSKNK